MTPDEAYEEARRRIRVAEKAGALELDLSGWNKTAQEFTGLETLNRLPQELKRFTSLQSLDLSRCEQLSGDLSPLTGLTSLQELNLSLCRQLNGDLSPLAGLTSLQTLGISGCKRLSGDLSPLATLTSLHTLNLSGFNGDLSLLTSLARSHLIWSRAACRSHLMWSGNERCFWARRFMFSGRYN
jgi:Leucine-rich repeat (LRR) protein